MNIRKHNVGEHRWHLSAKPADWRERQEFDGWIKEHMPNCFCVYREDYNTGAYYEVRGRNLGEMMMLVLRWGS